VRRWRRLADELYQWGEPQQKEVLRNAANWSHGVSVVRGSTRGTQGILRAFYQRDGGGDLVITARIWTVRTSWLRVEAITSPTTALHMTWDRWLLKVATILSLPPRGAGPERSAASYNRTFAAKNQRTGKLSQRIARGILRRRMSRESVSAHMIVQGRNRKLSRCRLRDSRGLTRLDYASRLPIQRSIAGREDGGHL